MYERFPHEELVKIESILDAVISAPTKQFAQRPLAELNSFAFSISGKIEPNYHQKLRSAIRWADAVSGQVADKDNKRFYAKSDWQVFASRVRQS